MMMEAAHTSETSVDIQLRTRQYIPEDSELHTKQMFSFWNLLQISFKHILISPISFLEYRIQWLTFLY
jgi:hypothetical protein